MGINEPTEADRIASAQARKFSIGSEMGAKVVVAEAGRQAASTPQMPPEAPITEKSSTPDVVSQFRPLKKLDSFVEAGKKLPGQQ